MYANVQIMWNDIPLAYAPIYKELFNSRNTRMSQKYLYPTYHEAFPEIEYMLLNIISLINVINIISLFLTYISACH